MEINKVHKDEIDQFTFFINNVQLTFFHYPFKIEFSKHFENILRMSDLLTLAAMKVYALGRRVKWKDYVDLYFIINKYHSIEKIIKRSKSILKVNLMKEFFANNWRILRILDLSAQLSHNML